MGRPIRDKLSISVVAVVIVLGTYLPWIKINPNLQSGAQVPAIQYYGMGTGFESFDIAIIFLTISVIIFRAISSRERFNILLTILLGGCIVVICMLYLWMSTLVGWNEDFVPSAGWYLTAIGGILLASLGGIELNQFNKKG